MSTHSCIARKNGTGFEGRYHHSDGYPKGLGAELYNIFRTVFQRDLGKMLKVLIDDHPAGWSCIVGADWSQEPGYCEAGGKEITEWLDNGHKDGTLRPRCYCHGNSSDEGDLVTSEEVADTDQQWAYVFHTATSGPDKGKAIMIVNKKVGEYDSYKWLAVAVVNLDDDDEPNWERIAENANPDED